LPARQNGGTIEATEVDMSKGCLALALALAAAQIPIAMEGAVEKQADRFETGKGTLEIVFLGHGSLAFEFNGARIYVDPVSQYADFRKYPKADLVLVTHEHGDHLDPAAIAALSKPGTRTILSSAAQAKYGKGEALGHGHRIEAAGIGVEAVPAYNTTSGRTNYHPKARLDNGYVLGIGSPADLRRRGYRDHTGNGRSGKDRYSVPSDEPALHHDSQQAASAAKTIKPRFLYPYHFGSTDTGALEKLLAGEKGIEVRIRNLQ
jgi:L-ascorbate metabolism protein UlaG (beta-lactamase superfamily)